MKLYLLILLVLSTALPLIYFTTSNSGVSTTPICDGEGCEIPEIVDGE